MKKDSLGQEGDQQEVLVEQTTMHVVLKYYNETYCFDAKKINLRNM